MPALILRARCLPRLRWSRELRLDERLGAMNFKGGADLNSGICGVALGRNATDFGNQRLEILRRGVLSRSGAGFARDILFHQRAPVVVGAGLKAQLGKA